MTSVGCNAWHRPVMLDASVDALQVRSDGLYVDVTAGGGGHSAAILASLGPEGCLYAADRDPEALEATKARLDATETEATVHVVRASFSEFPQWLPERLWGGVDGLIADLGVSSHQLDTAERGFSYLSDGPLDMRMNPDQATTAADLIAHTEEDDLVALLRLYGEERYATSIARAIVRQRASSPITRTLELAELVTHAVPPRARRDGHPARRTFQALRMAVNAEPSELSHLLHVLPEVMAPGGRVAIISFHSLEDRMVKQAMRRWESPCECPPQLPCVCGKQSLGKMITNKPHTPDASEVDRNRRARSAKLRVFLFEEADR